MTGSELRRPAPVILLVGLLVLTSCSLRSAPPDPVPSTPGPSAVSAAPTADVSAAPPSSPRPGTQTYVTDAASLTRALAAARPGLTIVLAAGPYRSKDVRDTTRSGPGRFVATTPGTAEAPITLRGPRTAVIDGGGTGGGYGLHLVGADHWRLQGFTVSSASKGIVLDRSSHVRIEGVRVTDIGAEGVHFRSFSSDNVLSGSDVDHTGVRKPNFGEGVYVGSAVSNWPVHSGSRPDASDRNQILDNRITATGAENIDLKEGSASGVVRGNLLDGSALAGRNSADSWIDVKGNDYLIEGNHGTRSLLDGFQVHVQAEGWGRGNVFTGNVLDVRGPGVGIWLQDKAVDRGNVIRCSNVVRAAAAGEYATNQYSPLPCTP